MGVEDVRVRPAAGGDKRRREPAGRERLRRKPHNLVLGAQAIAAYLSSSVMSTSHSSTEAAKVSESTISWTSAASVCASWERASATTEQNSGTMFRAVPPEITPTFAVVSSSSRPRRRSAIARAAAAMAERPSSGLIPACAARPRKTASTEVEYGAAPTISPSGPAWS